jgi:dienelactone hydrolase
VPQVAIRGKFDWRPWFWTSASTALAIACFGLAARAQVPAQDARNVNLPGTDTHMPLPQFRSLPDWEKRKAFLRQQVLTSTGLSPMPEKTPLHAQVFGKLEEKDYTIEKVLIETMPGFYLGGNLYRPRNGEARHPGILNPHGHWQYGRLENEPIFSGPAVGISLARQGYVVFAYDMVGYNDTIQVPHRFGTPEQQLWSFGPMAMQLWNGIRALDFLASLSDVDTARLGATGPSGGATQVFLLAAVDDRLQFASPVNMVSAIMQGGDFCENAPGLRIGTSNVEFAAMFAPKPMLLVSANGDWTHNVPREEYPAIRRIYDLYGKGDQVDVVQFIAPHNFNEASREAVYRFFAKLHPGLTNSQELIEHDISVPMLQDLLALSNRTLPPGALDFDGVFREWKAIAVANTAKISDLAFLRDRLRMTLAVEVPEKVIAEVHGQSIVLSRPGRQDRVPGIWIPGKGKTAIVVDPHGSSAALDTGVVGRLRKEHRPILLLDVFQTGASKAPRDQQTPHFLTFNVSDDAARVQDIVTAIVYSNQNDKSSQYVEVFATGDASVWATFAAAVSPGKVSLRAEDSPKLASDADYLAHFNVPGIQSAGGVAIAERLAAAH